MEWDPSNHAEASTAISQDLQQRNTHREEMDGCSRNESGISSSLARNLRVSDQLQQFSSFLQDEMSHPMTQSSVIGISCATTTLINPGSAPMLNSTTYCSKPHQMSNSNSVSELMGGAEMNIQHIEQREVIQPSDPESRCPIQVLNERESAASQVLSSTAEIKFKETKAVLTEEKQRNVQNNSSQNSSPLDNHSVNESAVDIPPEASLSKVQSSDVKLGPPSKSEKQEKCAGGKATSSSRKKNYDADLFFKVNGKLYQRLGKIGSGGSSEVHKVISSDCTIYALKKIKLKGRDYATAYGFCQEIEYLNKLKGKSHIIQLIDYEVCTFSSYFCIFCLLTFQMLLWTQLLLLLSTSPHTRDALDAFCGEQNYMILCNSYIFHIRNHWDIQEGTEVPVYQIVLYPRSKLVL